MHHAGNPQLGQGCVGGGMEGKLLPGGLTVYHVAVTGTETRPFRAFDKLWWKDIDSRDDLFESIM